MCDEIGEAEETSTNVATSSYPPESTDRKLLIELLIDIITSKQWVQNLLNYTTISLQNIRNIPHSTCAVSSNVGSENSVQDDIKKFHIF